MTLKDCVLFIGSQRTCGDGAKVRLKPGWKRYTCFIELLLCTVGAKFNVYVILNLKNDREAGL